MSDRVARIAGIAIAALMLIAFAVVVIHQLTSGKRAKIEARLGRNQVEAASKSGADAVNTIGAQHAAEGAIDDLTRSNADDIRAAEGADAPVSPAAAAAGRRSLCKRATYRERPECLQHAPAR